MKYSHKLLFISILFSIGVYVPYVTHAWVEYFAGIFAGYIFARFYRAQFKEAVLALGLVKNSEVRLAGKEKTKTDPRNYSLLVGATGIFIYLLVKGLFGGNTRDMLGSFCFGAIIGIFYYYAFLARRLEKGAGGQQKNLEGTRNNFLSKKKIFGIGVGIILLIIGIFLSVNTIDKNKPDINVIPTPLEVNTKALGDARLAYVKNGDIFLADKNGVEQITSGHSVSNLKVSQDGKYLGWIEKRDFLIEDGITRSVGFAVSLVDLTTLETTFNGVGPLNFVSSDDVYKKEITSFDFLDTNPLMIVYTSDGVWKKEFSNNKNEKLLENNYGNNDYINDDETYGFISKFPNINELLLTQGGFGTCVGRIYDLNDKRFVESKDFHGYGCEGKFLKDGKSFLVSKSFGQGYGGLWLIDVESGKITKTIYDSSRETNLSFHGADSIGNDQLVISIEEVVIGDKATRDQAVKQFQKGIYEIKNFDKPVFRLIKQVDNATVSRLDNYSSNKISYPVDSSLHTVDLDGQNDQVIVEGISEYVWIPVSQANAVQKVILDRVDSDKYLTFSLPNDFRFKEGNGFELGTVEDLLGQEIIRFSLQGGGERSPMGSLSIDGISFIIERGNIGGKINCRTTFYPKAIVSFDAGSRDYSEFTIDTTSCSNETRFSDAINSIIESIKFSQKAKDFLLTDYFLRSSVYTNNEHGFIFEHPSNYGLSNKGGFIFYLTDKANSLSINGKILSNINNNKSIKEWYIKYQHYKDWSEVEKDESTTEVTRNNINIISKRYASAEGHLIIDNFLLLKNGEVLGLSILVDSKVEDQIKVGEELNNLVVDSFKIK